MVLPLQNTLNLDNFRTRLFICDQCCASKLSEAKFGQVCHVMKAPKHFSVFMRTCGPCHAAELVNAKICRYRHEQKPQQEFGEYRWVCDQ